MTTAKPVRHPRLSLRARVALLAGVAVALAIFVTTVGVYLSVRNQLYSQLDQDMLTRAQTTAGAVSSPDQLLSLPPELLGRLRRVARARTSLDICWRRPATS